MDLFNELAGALYPKEIMDEIQENCDHEWVHQPAEYESLSGRATVLQYPELYYCEKCGLVEEELC